jgi:hypothetical protein
LRLYFTSYEVVILGEIFLYISAPGKQYMVGFESYRSRAFGGRYLKLSPREQKENFGFSMAPMFVSIRMGHPSSKRLILKESEQVEEEGTPRSMQLSTLRGDC